jgi:uncharacterized protein (DUF58 family)
MRRTITWVALAATALLLLLPSAVLAQAPGPRRAVRRPERRRAAAGSEADAVVVIRASGRVEGVSRTVFVVGGSAVFYDTSVKLVPA